MAKSNSAREHYKRILASRRKGELFMDLAKRHGLDARTFYRWRARFKASTEAVPRTTQTPDLVPVRVANASAGLDLGSLVAPDFEVALRKSGHVLRVPSSFEASALGRLVETLEDR